MKNSVSQEGKKIIKILSGFREFKGIGKKVPGKLNKAVNNALRKLRSKSSAKAKEAVKEIDFLHKQKIWREAEERGCFIGFDPDYY